MSHRKHSVERDRAARQTVAAIAIMVMFITGMVMSHQPDEESTYEKLESASTLALGSTVHAAAPAPKMERDSGERDRNLARERDRPARE